MFLEMKINVNLLILTFISGKTFMITNKIVSILVFNSNILQLYLAIAKRYLN